jgi:NADH-quinone oxidoreductase subunit J
MTSQQLIFIILAVITLASGLVVVTNRNLFHAALAMMLAFFGVAGFYVLLEAPFLAASQLLVYIGAISILIIFAIMMTRRLMSTDESPFNSQWVAALIGTLLIGGLILFVIVSVFSPFSDIIIADSAPFSPAVQQSTEMLGLSFVNPDQYVIPFEIASVLLLGALVGSIAIARPEKDS